jgi:glutamyl-tRNA synthetase
MESKVVTRFAPSPTGFMHVGGARTALFAWAFARKNKGKFILRIEDTDKEREVAGSIDQIVNSLKWLGLDWDEGVDIGGPNAPYKQSERLPSYKKYADLLVSKGLAYADPRSNDEIDLLRSKDLEENKLFLYRNHRPVNPPLWDGSQPLKLKITDIKSYEWKDLVRGNLSAGEESLDDFIIMKSDGFPTYNFAHIIDDLEMGVTHIFRADEFLASMPRFLALYEALQKVTDLTIPKFVALPPIMGPDGKKKLGKRDGAKDLLDYKKEGILPEAMMNFLALIGWNPGTEKEIFTPEEFINAFQISGIQNAGGALNEEKLLWFNKEHIKLLPNSSIAEEIKIRLPSELQNSKTLPQVIEIVKERISKWADVDLMVQNGELDFFYEKPLFDKNLLTCPEKLRKGQEVSDTQIKEHLDKIITYLETIPETSFTSDSVKNAVWDYATEKGRGIVLWAMRVALSGKEKSPDPFQISAIIGKEETILRLTNAAKL